MSSKTEGNSSRKKEDKKPTDVRKYAQISVDSTNAAADSIGISDLNEEVSKRLSDDVSYRLREIISKCAVHKRHMGRKKLTAGDVNFVLQNSDAPPCFGHPLKESLKFTYIREARVFVPEDEEVNLVSIALRSEVYQQNDESYVKARWVFPDNPASEKTGAKSGGQTAPIGIQILPHHLKYYQQISKALLSKSMKLIHMAITDLKTNPNINSVAPLIVNLIAAYIYKYKCNGVKIYFLMQAIDALLENKKVDLRASDKSNTLVTSLLLFTINPSPINGKSTLDDVFLRKCASKQIVKILKIWHPLEVIIYIEIYYNCIGALFNPENSLHCHLGALSAINQFGSEALDKCFWPNLKEYFEILEKSDKSLVIEDIKGEILSASERLFIKSIHSPNIRESIIFKCDLELQDKLREYFGDALCARHRCFGTPGNVLIPAQEETCSEAFISPTDREWTSVEEFKSLRCLPFSSSNRIRYSASDVFDKVDPCSSMLNQLSTTHNLSSYIDKFVKRFHNPPRMFQFHSSYSKSRFIGKLRSKSSPTLKNNHVNLLALL